MQVQTYYLIRPKQQLLAFESIDELSRDVLARPHLWESTEGGKTMWSAADYVARAKLAFLINLRSEYAGAPGVERLFNGPQISLRVFDEYWDIESLDLDGQVSEISNVNMPEHVVEPTGLPHVDGWLSNVGVKLDQ